MRIILFLIFSLNWIAGADITIEQAGGKTTIIRSLNGEVLVEERDGALVKLIRKLDYKLFRERILKDYILDPNIRRLSLIDITMDIERTRNDLESSRLSKAEVSDAETHLKEYEQFQSQYIKAETEVFQYLGKEHSLTLRIAYQKTRANQILAATLLSPETAAPVTSKSVPNMDAPSVAEPAPKANIPNTIEAPVQVPPRPFAGQQDFNGGYFRVEPSGDGKISKTLRLFDLNRDASGRIIGMKVQFQGGGTLQLSLRNGVYYGTDSQTNVVLTDSYAGTLRKRIDSNYQLTVERPNRVAFSVQMNISTYWGTHSLIGINIPDSAKRWQESMNAEFDKERDLEARAALPQPRKPPEPPKSIRFPLELGTNAVAKIAVINKVELDSNKRVKTIFLTVNANPQFVLIRESENSIPVIYKNATPIYFKNESSLPNFIETWMSASLTLNGDNLTDLARLNYKESFITRKTLLQTQYPRLGGRPDYLNPQKVLMAEKPVRTDTVLEMFVKN